MMRPRFVPHVSMLALLAVVTAGGAHAAASPAAQPAADGAAGPAADVVLVSPGEDVAVVGSTTIEVGVAAGGRVPSRIVVFVDGRELCVRERAPWSCGWDAGPRIDEHHIRVVATFADGRRRVLNRRTKGITVSEAVDVAAIQVPVLVVDGSGQFRRGLKRDDFTLLEEGRRQRIDSVIDDELPLELIVAIDVSSSMEEAMPRVREAVKRLLAKLRPGDTATLLGFNDTMFVLAEREGDAELREAAVDSLLPWGGTALYDATVKSIDMVSQQAGRRGVIVFSDGADRHSVGRREEALATIQEGQVVLYTVGFGEATSAQFRETLTTFAEASGGRAFFPRQSGELDSAFESILEELSHQYVLSYVSNVSAGTGWRRLEVKANCTGCRVRAREGYRVPEPQP